MATEKDARKRIVKALKEFDAQPVENIGTIGCPDVECTLGWIELKYLKAWPKRADTLVRFPIYTPQQRSWQRRRRRRGGNVWMLVKVGRNEWLLYDAEAAANLLGRLNRTQMEQTAILHLRDHFDKDRLVFAMLQGLPDVTPSGTREDAKAET